MARVAEPLRGQVWFVTFPTLGEKPVLVVSNNQRNSALPTVLAVRVTTTPKPALSTIVELPRGEPLAGRVLCDDVVLVPKERLKRRAGALSAPTMRLVEAGLRDALAL